MLQVIDKFETCSRYSKRIEYVFVYQAAARWKRFQRKEKKLVIMMKLVNGKKMLVIMMKLVNGKKMLVIMMRLMNVLKMLVIMSLLKMKIKMGRRKMGRRKMGEDADNTIVGETDQNGGDYSLYGKVLDEDEEDDDNICFEEIEKTYAKTNAIEGGKSDCTSIYVNQSFVSKNALLSELRLTAVRGRFSFRIYKSTKTLLVAICRVSGCGWKIRASVKHGSNTFWVTKYVEKHLCSIGDRIAQRRHCTPKYVGSLFIDRVGIIDGITPQHITDAMKNMFGMTLDYTTSYRALLYAQKLVRGSAEEGYSRLPSYLEQISIANPDSITAIELDSEKRFKYLFLSFGASIKGFKYQRRVIVVDGTHLSGKYGGVMLVAAAQDGNFQIFPLAFGIVDAEDEPSWEWFFTKLASCISHDKPLVIVSDRHAAIKSACEKVFPWATRGICYYHLQDNIVKKFKGKHLMYLVKGAAYAHTFTILTGYMAEIRSANPGTCNVFGEGRRQAMRARGFPIPFLLEFIRQKLENGIGNRRQDAFEFSQLFFRRITLLHVPIEKLRFAVRIAFFVYLCLFLVKGNTRTRRNNPQDGGKSSWKMKPVMALMCTVLLIFGIRPQIFSMNRHR
ncbi:hypothetical protein Rs2_43523 [Raphanus sativus]|nr:hypothetical protein Rs2_43523 [Raphanus sativus]